MKLPDLNDPDVFERVRQFGMALTLAARTGDLGEVVLASIMSASATVHRAGVSQERQNEIAQALIERAHLAVEDTP